MLSLSGIPIPDHLDGIDLNPLLTGADPLHQHNELFWDTKVECAVRQGQWKLLITRKIPNQRLQIVETPIGEFLYDLSKDPGELNDLSNEYQAVFEKLKSALEEWQSVVNQESATYNTAD